MQGVEASRPTVALFRGCIMGALFNHTVISASLDEAALFIENKGGEFWGADAAGESVGTVEPPACLALAVGNEGAGLSSSVRERVKRLVSLPISAGVESLNVAVAAGILLYELRK